MAVTPENLHFIVCPQCKGDLKYTREQVLFCVRCRLCYPLEEGVPHLSIEKALPLAEDGSIIPREKTATFFIESGNEVGAHFRLSYGTCKAIGRKLDDEIKTVVFNADFTMSLDDHTKKLVVNYLNKNKKKAKETQTEIGNLKRLPDLVLGDEAVSRLHAMLFYDESGVGVLDLVSKNGTFVNGREVEGITLKSGDEIQLGDTRLRVTFQ